MNAMMERRQRPLGITVISVVLFIFGIFELISSIVVLVLSHAARVSTHIPHVLGMTLDVFGNVFGIIGLVIAIVTLFVAYGLFTLKRWAFWLVVIVEIISLIRHAFEISHPNQAIHTLGIIGIIIPILILLYMFLDANVRRAFRVL
ncbi:MAG TPA: hypothetical protein DHW02_19455 [Ktedonobacter sp.]|jgi:hypothetical protein|nr:hypothetical protein [Ktedonobacter sp.]